MSTIYDIRFAIDPVRAAELNTAGLRDNFLIADLFVPGQVRWTYSHYDRMMVGSAVPDGAELALETIRPTGTAALLERRELIAVNIGMEGSISVDGVAHAVGPRDMLYVGKGAKDVRFQGNGARYYLLSAPAHASHPTKLLSQSGARRLEVGSNETANARSIYQYVNADSVRTCQLVVGLTQFAPGSVWNTMPAHVHDRRMEAYLYFGLDADAFVVHLMGKPDETRHLIVRNEQAILSPPWSIHSGVGTGAYTFIWAMAGDNVDYADMDKVAMGDLR
jgi:4-deoxy-L-threo-5-hexosulose-uronate ketol-isomerase